MEFATWDVSYSVNVSMCDEDHKKLFSLLNALHGAMTAGKGREVIQQVVNLADYTRYHFSREEMLLSQTHYPNLIPHKAQHSIFAKKVEEFQLPLKAGDPFLSIAVAAFLRDWVEHHIKQTDRQYSAHLNACGIS